MTVESGYDPDVVTVDRDSSYLGRHMTQCSKGYGTVIDFAAYAKMSKERRTPERSAVEPNLGSRKAVICPGPGYQLTADDLRAIWLVQVMEMAGMTKGWGTHKQGYQCSNEPHF